MATHTINVPGQAITANTWLFSTGVSIPADANSCLIQVTDPNSQWFTKTGNVKEFGLQLQGYVGGPWDDQAPWAGWGWWLYTPGGDPLQNLLLPASWIPFGTQNRSGGVGLAVGISSTELVANAGKIVRLAIQTDTDITLGLRITLT